MSAVGNIATGIIAVMMLITVSDIVGRRVFNQPVTGTYEFSRFMMVIVVFFTIAHCEFLRSHITIDLLVSRLRQRTQDIIDSITYVFFLVTFCFLTWQLYLYAIEVWQRSLTAGILKIPVFPVISIAALGCALLSFVILIRLLLFVAGALKK